jgi:four helix bundle protein
MTMNNEGQSSGTVRSFEDLRIWQQSRLLVRDVYMDFADGTCAARDFGFRRQIQEAAVSIMNNIAEGFERRTDGEFARFLDIAKGSCGEVRSMYYVAEDLRYVSATIAQERRERARQIAAGIGSLTNHLRPSPHARPRES